MRRKKKPEKSKSKRFAKIKSAQNRLKQIFVIADKKGGFDKTQEILFNQVEQMLYDINRTINVRLPKGFKKELKKKILEKLRLLEEQTSITK